MKKILFYPIRILYLLVTRSQHRGYKDAKDFKRRNQIFARKNG
jgi:hypothetical protein